MNEELLEAIKDLHILYVEDNELSRESMLLLLQEYFNHITIAADGKEALEYFFNDNTIDLILTDINMPVMNGIEMIRKIKQTDSDTPIIILSAHNDMSYFLDAIKLNVSGYLLKPINLEEFENEFMRVAKNILLKKELQEKQYLLEQYQKIVDASLIVSKTDLKGVITYVNDNFCEVSGYSKEELIGVPHNIVRHPDISKKVYADLWHTISKEKKLWSGVIKNRKKSGGSYYVKSYVKPIVDTKGDILEYIALRNNITEIMNPLKQLKDSLQGTERPVLLYMKLDQFQIVSELFDKDTIEHMQSKLARLIAQHLPHSISKPAVFQLGEGEFASVLDPKVFHEDKDSIINEVHEMIHAIKKEVINLGEFAYDVSIVASFSYDNEKLIENAKLGIDKVLQEGGCFCIANDLIDEEERKLEKNMKTLIMIQKALEHDNIISYFQPIVDNKTEKILRYESLVRLIDEEGKVISPFFFLDTAKKGRYYTEITKQVLENSFKMLKNSNEGVSINLSALDIENIEINHYILNLLESFKEDAPRVIFELLEDESVKNIQTIVDFIKKVKSYGVQIAIDDFGSGYSNYERLLQYQPDILKIDGSLIKNIQSDHYSLSIVKSIVSFAKEQNFKTVAEFVENEEIFNILKSLGIDYSQGYYFSKPKPLEEL